jgi:hypothetical protein
MRGLRVRDTSDDLLKENAMGYTDPAVQKWFTNRTDQVVTLVGADKDAFVKALSDILKPADIATLNAAVRVRGVQCATPAGALPEGALGWAGGRDWYADSV